MVQNLTIFHLWNVSTVSKMAPGRLLTLIIAPLFVFIKITSVCIAKALCNDAAVQCSRCVFVCVDAAVVCLPLRTELSHRCAAVSCRALSSPRLSKTAFTEGHLTGTLCSHSAPALTVLTSRFLSRIIVTLLP